ncbi:plasmid replication protein RepC [Paracoccus sp. (in: a-proteobacteria)]|uniref:plasmid replication protein RepC n=1 Tax=Paracoccus sp. TaxID=267 RepID=UPI0035AEF4D0
MKHISMTPFGRQPVTAGLLAARALAEAPAPQDRADKWALLRDLTAARGAYGVSDRDLAVLAALISFHPRTELTDDAQLIVFPSNASLSTRAHGMPESTLRRHLAALVKAGLILRRDSPNGKRYATRGASGQLARAFGFDLRPLLVQAGEIAAHAETARNTQARMRDLRTSITIHLRDAMKLIAWGRNQISACWDQLTEALTLMQRHLRRKLDATHLERMQRAAFELVTRITDLIPSETPQTSANDSQNERHLQNSIPDSYESESCTEDARDKAKPAPGAATRIPLGLVLKAAPDLADYAPGEIRTPHDLLDTAHRLRPMLGIGEETWHDACRIMGPEPAAITLACMLQSVGRIANPGGYLRNLSHRARRGQFSAARMVQALLRAERTCPS